MKRFILLTNLLISCGLSTLSAQSTGSDWSSHKAKKWFKKKEWLNDLSITPHSSIDKVQFAKQYHLNQAAWDKAFAYLKNTDLRTLANGKHVIDGDNVYAIVTEARTKDYDKTAFESHRKYIDLQHVITGEENMAKAPVTSVTLVNHMMKQLTLLIIPAKEKFISCLLQHLCFSFQQKHTGQTLLQMGTKW